MAVATKKRRKHSVRRGNRMENVCFFISGLRPQLVRTYRQFAEQEIILPNGPCRGLRFSTAFMPWSGLVLDEFAAGRYRRFWAAGPVQSGKTLLFYVIPVLYHLFEMGEDVINGLPNVDLAVGIFNERLLPIIRHSRYADLLPTHGAGSRGGKTQAIQFGNGAILRFMGAGGGDEQRSSHTARVVVVSEADKMDVPGKASREADPVTQFEARTQSFGDRALMFGECNMTITGGRINQEVTVIGTDSRVYVPCSYCGEFVFPDREHFVGWKDLDDMMAAREQARWACSECGVMWSEADRAAALLHPVLAAKGQKVSADGAVTGDLPKTHTFGFRWNAMQANPVMMSMANIAEQEWRADRLGTSSDRKMIHQHVWAMPYDENIEELSGITEESILEKITRHPRGVAPAGTVRLTVAIDLGLHQCWWSAWAWQADGTGHCIDYGEIEVPQDRKADPLRILGSLRTFRDLTLVPGWQTADGKPIRHDVCLIDEGYQKEIARKFADESGVGRYFAFKGLGTAEDRFPGESNAWRDPSAVKNRFIDETLSDPQWYVTIGHGTLRVVHGHSDYWKAQVHGRFLSNDATAGTLHLYSGEKMFHRTYARHIVAERQKSEYIPGKGNAVFWERMERANHHLDDTYMNLVAADMLKIRMIAATIGPEKPVAVRAPALRAGEGGSSGIRTTY